MKNNLTALARELVIGLEGEITNESIQNLIDSAWLEVVNGYIQVAK